MVIHVNASVHLRCAFLTNNLTKILANVNVLKSRNVTSHFHSTLVHVSAPVPTMGSVKSLTLLILFLVPANVQATRDAQRHSGLIQTLANVNVKTSQLASMVRSIMITPANVSAHMHIVAQLKY